MKTIFPCRIDVLVGKVHISVRQTYYCTMPDTSHNMLLVLGQIHLPLMDRNPLNVSLKEFFVFNLNSMKIDEFVTTKTLLSFIEFK